MNTKHFLIKKGETLLDAMRREGEYVPAYCGGSGICGKCRVQFISPAPEPTEAEKHFFSEEELMAGWRLACMTKTEGSADIALPEEAAESTMEAETGFSLDGGEDARPGQGNLATCQEQIVGAESDTQNYDAAGQAAHAVPRFVVAVDIGTTTLAASLVDTGAQEVLRTVTSVNHQRAFGADVISRMEASNQGKGNSSGNVSEKTFMSFLHSFLCRKIRRWSLRATPPWDTCCRDIPARHSAWPRIRRWIFLCTRRRI